MFLEKEEEAHENNSRSNQRDCFYNNDDERTTMVTPSHLIEHIFCPRFTFFLHCLKIPQHEEKRFKVLKGREIHEKKLEFLKDYTRKRIGCVTKESNVYLANKEIRVRGIIDEILHLEDGTLAPLDYKFAEFNDFVYKTHKVQSALYALLIKKAYNKEVIKGFIVYCRSKNKLVEIVYKNEDFCYALNVVKEFFDIVEKSYYPKATRDRNKCIDCCYKNICV